MTGQMRFLVQPTEGPYCKPSQEQQTYGSWRVHAELTLGMGVRVSERLVAVLMSQARIAGLSGAGEGEAAARRCDRRRPVS